MRDLTGNVVEWTESLFGKNTKSVQGSVHGGLLKFVYPYDAADGREDIEAGPEIRRVVRGGTWHFDQNYARTAHRLDGLPDFRFNHLGFRVAVVSSPISS